MKLISKLATTSLMLGAMTVAAMAENAPTLALDLAAMPGKAIWGGHAKVTPLAMDAHGKPSTIVIHMEAGVQADASHATGDGQVRIVSVLSGVMYFADGAVVDPAKEVAYGPGSVVLIDSGTPHWLSSHDGEVVIMLTAVPADKFSPMVQAQQKAGN